mmetsp:Transcript_40892/g.73242  ORF Transcript_40892/g.73242 Transcript_40892/m.73242 type:complete len:210 (+) Transcript_40892:175-804(+)
MPFSDVGNPPQPLLPLKRAAVAPGPEPCPTSCFRSYHRRPLCPKQGRRRGVLVAAVQAHLPWGPPPLLHCAALLVPCPGHIGEAPTGLGAVTSAVSSSYRVLRRPGPEHAATCSVDGSLLDHGLYSKQIARSVPFGANCGALQSYGKCGNRRDHEPLHGPLRDEGRVACVPFCCTTTHAKALSSTGLIRGAAEYRQGRDRQSSTEANRS